MKLSGEHWLLCAIARKMLYKPMTVGNLAVAFCNLPNHQQMEEAFIASRGRYNRRKFLEDFHCPGWAYDFLRTQCLRADGDDREFYIPFKRAEDAPTFNHCHMEVAYA